MTGQPHVTMSTDQLAIELFTTSQVITGQAEAERLLQQIKDQHAHLLAQQQRNHFGVGDTPKIRAHCDPNCDFCRGVVEAADLIDPEKQR